MCLAFVVRRFLRTYFVALKRAVFSIVVSTADDRPLPACLAAEAVQRPALALQRIDDVHGRHGLALGVFRIGHGIADDVLQEDLENAAGFFVDETGNTLDATTTRQTTNGRLRDALDVVAQHLPVAFGASLAQSFASFSSARHVSFEDSSTTE